jgi:shikimate kinase
LSGYVQRCVLVGLPGSGKTVTGSLLARALGWTFYDIDAEITRRTGLSVAQLFQTHGEVAFRAMEVRLTAELSSLADTVLAPGGGWAAQPGALDGLPPGTAIVWLRVSPEEAIRRLRGSPLRERPLLAGPDPLATMRSLLHQRSEYYERADLIVAVDDRGAEEISLTISEWLRRRTS